MQNTDMFAFWISLILSNFGLVMLIVAAIFMLIHVMVRGGRISGYEIIYRWVALFPLGFTGLYAGIMHIVFPEMSAAVIGWANSPFQFEVGVAGLGFGLIGLLSFNASYGFRLAAVVGNVVWLWGDALGHIYQMINYQNFAIGNAGSWFWMDVLIPLILLICIIKLKLRYKERYV